MALSAKDSAAVKAAAKAGGLSSSQANAIVAKANSAGSNNSSSSSSSSSSGTIAPLAIDASLSAADQAAVAKAYLQGGGSASNISLKGTPAPGITYTPTGNPQLDQILKSLAGTAGSIIDSGYSIPPGLQITPDIVSKFLGWAHQVVDPQTQQLINNEADNINASLNNAATQYKATQGDLVQKFGTDLATEQNAAGGNGTAFSGQRALNENNLAASTNRSLASLDAATSLSIGDALRSSAAKVGADNTNRFNLPTLASGMVYPTGGQRGSFSLNGPSLDFGYNPSSYKAGTIPTAQNTALNNLQANYLNQYGTLAGNNSGRSVTDLFKMMSGLPQGAI